MSTACDQNQKPAPEPKPEQPAQEQKEELELKPADYFPLTSNTEPNDDLVILKTPLKTGTKWETKDGTREIVDINATIDTPAGKFTQAIKVKITFPDSTMYEYFKDGVGMVKREFISGETTISSTLEKYEIRKP